MQALLSRWIGCLSSKKSYDHLDQKLDLRDPQNVGPGHSTLEFYAIQNLWLKIALSFQITHLHRQRALVWSGKAEAVNKALLPCFVGMQLVVGQRGQDHSHLAVVAAVAVPGSRSQAGIAEKEK